MITFDAGSDALDLDLVEHAFDEPPFASQLPKLRGSISGTQLRRRLITPDVLAAMNAEEPRPTMLQRMFGRKPA